MLARVSSYGFVSACDCVCMSVTSRYSMETAERIELVFGTGASFHLSYTVVLKGNSGISINQGTFLWKYFQNS